MQNSQIWSSGPFYLPHPLIVPSLRGCIEPRLKVWYGTACTWRLPLLYTQCSNTGNPFDVCASVSPLESEE